MSGEQESRVESITKEQAIEIVDNIFAGSNLDLTEIKKKIESGEISTGKIVAMIVEDGAKIRTIQQDLLRRVEKDFLVID